MSRLTALLAVVLPCCSLTALPLTTHADDTGAPGRPIRALVVYGGHGFNQGQFFSLLDSIPNLEYDRLDLKRSPEKLNPGVADRYDVLVQYDMISGLKPEQHEAYKQLLAKGINVIALHHTIGARRAWPEYRKVLGGLWLWEPTEIDGKTYPKSTYKHGVTIPVAVADPDHPITQGLNDFEIVDEQYGNLYVSPDVHVLLTTDKPGCNSQIAWTTRYGNSRVFYLMLGHDNHAWSNPVYGKILGNAIQWATNE